MKFTLVFLAACIAVAMAAKACQNAGDCSCHNANEVANCEHGVCVCVVTGTGKRETHTCTADADCANYDCHGHGTASCVHHGSTEHGSNLCTCTTN